MPESAPQEIRAYFEKALNEGSLMTAAAGDTETMSCPAVAVVLQTSYQGLAQMRHRGTGPKFAKLGRKVIYRRADMLAFLEANTVQRTASHSD